MVDAYTIGLSGDYVSLKNIYHMKRERRLMSSETHYSKPLTHRQRAKGITKRYVSFNAAGFSTCLGCWKNELHTHLRQEDRTSIEEQLLNDGVCISYDNDPIDAFEYGEVVYSTSTIKEDIDIVDEDTEFDDMSYELHLEYLKYRKEALDSITDEEIQEAIAEREREEASMEEFEETHEMDDFDWDNYTPAEETVEDAVEEDGITLPSTIKYLAYSLLIALTTMVIISL